MTRTCCVYVFLSVVAASGLAGEPVRVGTYNVENFSAGPGDPQFEAALAVLQRVGADVVCLEEMVSTTAFNQLGEAAGYPYRVLAHSGGTLDPLRKCGVISVYPIVSWSVETAAGLSGDPLARDITRNFVVARVDLPRTHQDLVVIVNHWQSMNTDADEFRRSIESLRAMQVADRFDSASVPYFIMGDMNDDLLDAPDWPRQFYNLPGGLPDNFKLGDDIVFPVNNGAFLPMQAGTGSQALTVVDAWQLDGTDATHYSNRRLDYLWHSDAVSVLGSEVYDSADEWLGGGLPKYGEPLDAGTSRAASDHLIVFADARVNEAARLRVAKPAP